MHDTNNFPFSIKNVDCNQQTVTVTDLPSDQDTALGMHQKTGCCTFMAALDNAGTPTAVFENLDDQAGSIAFATELGVALTMPKTLEPMKVPPDSLYHGRTIEEIRDTKNDILGEEILADPADPTFERIAECFPPLKYCTFVGTRHSIEKIEFNYGGKSRLYTDSVKLIKDVQTLIDNKEVSEGLIGGFLPVVRWVFPTAENEWWEMAVFADEDPSRTWTQPGWYRFMRIEDGQVKQCNHFFHHIPFPPRQEPTAAEFYAALLKLDTTYRDILSEGMQIELPDERIADFCAHSFIREMITRIKDHPKYGIDIWEDGYRVGYGFINVDTFQDTFTSAVITNLEWGKVSVAKRYIDDYFTESVRDDGSIDTRGAEIGQYGRMLAAMAQYYNYTKDKDTILKYQGKLLAIVDILLNFLKEARALPADNPAYGIIHAWSEHDSCLRYDPYTTFMLPYLSNNSEVARGFCDFGKALAAIGESTADATLKSRGTQLVDEAAIVKTDLITSAERTVQRDQDPPYLPGIAGVTDPTPPHLMENVEHGMWIAGRIYSELLYSGVLTPELVKIITDYQSANSGRTLGLLRAWEGPGGIGMLGFIVYGYAYGILNEDWVREFLMFYYAHMAHLHTRGTWTAAELANYDGTEFTPYCAPAQMTIPALTKWMLVFEDPDDPIVWLARAATRPWFEQDKAIKVKDAPTRWGVISYDTLSDIDNGTIAMNVSLPADGFAAALKVRLRAPLGKTMQSVTVNGEDWQDFDSEQEVVNIPAPTGNAIEVVAMY